MAVAMAWLLGGSPALAQDTPPEPPPQQAPAPAEVPRQRFWTGLSVGVGWEKVFTTSGQASNPFPYRFLFRNPTKSGWAITPMFGWFSSDIDAVAFERPEAALGRMTVRPILVGVRRTWVLHPMSYDVAAVAGPSFNSFKLDAEAGPLVGAGSGSVTSDANVSLSWRLQASTWHDFNDKVAIRGSIAYAWNQVEVTFDGAASDRHRITQNANSVQLGFGVVYRIF
jgi:hypothetical protein